MQSQEKHPLLFHYLNLGENLASMIVTLIVQVFISAIGFWIGNKLQGQK